MEAWRSEDGTRWIDFNGMEESDGCIRIYDGFPDAGPETRVDLPALVLRDDVATGERLKLQASGFACGAL